MFQKINKTVFPPEGNAIMVWDGNCSFCKYWVTVWKCKTGDNLSYATYQKVADYFKDIPKKHFVKAVRLIEKDGRVYGGPEAAYRSMLYYQHPMGLWYRLYRRAWLFRKISDYGYKFVTDHRGFMLTVTKMMWGSNPCDRKMYWLAYLSLIFVSLLIFFVDVLC